MSDILFMQRALELAKLGRRGVSPNPMVGCVVVLNNKIIGEGFHQKYGEAHAEVNAIQSVKDHSVLPDSTVYVTLEPCAHFGKTPPCTDLLITKNVKRVFIACRDPFVHVDGKGIEKLRKAGVEVNFGLLEDEAVKLNRRFFTFHLKKRPYIILKWAQTQDGFIARENYDSKWISNQYSRQLVHKWRAEEDAIMVGKNTAIYDNPSLNVRDWTGAHPTRILLDSKLEVPADHELMSGSIETLILNMRKNEEKGATKWIKTESTSPSSISSVLHENKVQSVIIEGGSQLLNSFISENCWDEARVFSSGKQFTNGIPAPIIEGEVIEKNIVQNDQLTIYKNHHG